MLQEDSSRGQRTHEFALFLYTVSNFGDLWLPKVTASTISRDRVCAFTFMVTPLHLCLCAYRQNLPYQDCVGHDSCDGDQHTRRLSLDSQSVVVKSGLVQWSRWHHLFPNESRQLSQQKKRINQNSTVRSCRMPSLIARSWLRTCVFKAFNAAVYILDCF